MAGGVTGTAGSGGGGSNGNSTGQSVGVYDSTLLSAPPYDPATGGAILFDPSGLHLAGNGVGHMTSFGSSKVGGRHHRAGRGSSVSPKRPNHRSVSQNNSGQTQHQRRSSGQTGPSAGSASGGRYTPSPSSGRSRGSSPGQPILIGNNGAHHNNNNSSSSNNNGSNPSASNNPAGNPPMVILHGGGSAACPPPPSTPGQHVVHLHVNPGETVSLQMGGQVQVIQGKFFLRILLLLLYLEQALNEGTLLLLTSFSIVRLLLSFEECQHQQDVWIVTQTP